MDLDILIRGFKGFLFLGANFYVVGFIIMFACWPYNDEDRPTWYWVMWTVICVAGSVAIWAFYLIDKLMVVS